MYDRFREAIHGIAQKYLTDILHALIDFEEVEAADGRNQLLSSHDKIIDDILSILDFLHLFESNRYVLT